MDNTSIFFLVAFNNENKIKNTFAFLWIFSIFLFYLICNLSLTNAQMYYAQYIDSKIETVVSEIK